MTQEQKPLPGAGRDLDKLVAEKMGREVKTIATNSSGQPIYRMSLELGDWKSWTGVPAYSTSIAAAWELVGHIKEKVSEYIRIDCYPEKWIVLIKDPTDHFTRQLSSGRAETAPLAICRAFLALPDFEVKE